MLELTCLSSHDTDIYAIRAVLLTYWNNDKSTHTHTHTHTHTLGLLVYVYWGLSIDIMIFILFKLYILSPKPTHHLLHIYIFKKHHLV